MVFFSIVGKVSFLLGTARQWASTTESVQLCSVSWLLMMVSQCFPFDVRLPTHGISMLGISTFHCQGGFLVCQVQSSFSCF